MTAPTTLKGWWREDFTSSNLTAQPFYECPIFSQEVGAEPVSTCMGGNNTVTSCAKGFDTSGPHEKEWKCIPCPYGGACGGRSTECSNNNCFKR